MVSVFQRVLECLLVSDPVEKCNAVFKLHEKFLSETLSLEKFTSTEEIIAPGRPEKPILVLPQSVPRRTLSTTEGRVALIHAITHIEFNAINLALDAIFRFQQMPEEYYIDWMRVAFEEAQHFSMLSKRLNQHDCKYGELHAHNGLWEMAMKTRHSVLARMALVPRVLEARGLDVTPRMIQRLESVGDHETVEILHIIFEQEIGHVAIGSRWFKYACAQQNLVPEEMFQNLLDEYMSGELRGPFELEARKQAGFSNTELQALQKVKLM